jgi:hypothetical protein
VANLRKLIATALTSSDQSERYLQETALDRVRALAFADALGASLWRLVYANQAESFHRVVLLLCKKMRRKHEPIRLVETMCRIVVLEYLDGVCRPCQGRGVRADEAGVRHTCPACNGTGRGTVSEQGRKRGMGLSDRAYARWEPRFRVAHEKLADADLSARYDVACQLGRIGGPVAEKRALSLFLRRVILASGEPAHSSNYMPGTVVHSTSSA